MRLILSALLLLTLVGCSDEAEQNVALTPETMTRGSDLYNYYCRHCHKVRGPGELLEHRDTSRRALKNHELMMLMQFGDSERHRNMPTFMDTDPEKLQLIANYISTELTADKSDSTAESATSNTSTSQ